eukprot:7537068-Pyramimonas_sp.AAC.1
MPGTLKGESLAALEASRGALLAVHAAAGLAAASGRRPAARLVRAAEGLLRTAIAQLGAPPANLEPAADAGPTTAQRRRRPRGRGRVHG